MKKRNRSSLKLQRRPRRKIVMITAYDTPTGRLLDEAGVDLILVGDSLGTVMLGYASTRQVSMDEMIHHARAVRRGVSRTPLIGDLPFFGENIHVSSALSETRRYVRRAQLDGVKLEGYGRYAELARSIVSSGIPLMGHVGLTPQYAPRLGGYKVQGRKAQRAREILRSAECFERLGAFAVVLECIPHELARIITRKLTIPTIGIGAGPHCDGQVLVFHDLVGLSRDFQARFFKAYDNLYERERLSVSKFIRDVRNRRFPTSRQSFRMKAGEFETFLSLLKISP